MAERVWGAFSRLHRSRATGFDGGEPIGPVQIMGWSVIHGQRLSEWEIEAIYVLDDLILGRAEVQEPARPMTPQLFDAIFAGKKA